MPLDCGNSGWQLHLISLSSCKGVYCAGHRLRQSLHDTDSTRRCEQLATMRQPRLAQAYASLKVCMQQRVMLHASCPSAMRAGPALLVLLRTCK